MTKYSKEFKLPENKRIKEYSSGMKMKLKIAVALSHHPKLLILDEPTSGLDPVARNEVLDILNSGEADYITFASSSTVTNFVDIIGKENIDKLNELKVISIGPITTQTAKSLNINVYSEAEVSTIDGMIDSIMNDK